MPRHPLALLPALAGRRLPFLLDGAPVPGGGTSFAGADPARVLVARGDRVRLTHRRGGSVHRENPFDALAREVARGDFALAVGFLGYELGRFAETMPDPVPDDLHLPELHVAFYDDVVRFDRPSTRIPTLPDDPEPVPLPPGAAGALTSSLPRAAYLDAVRDVKVRLVAGDAYQVNVTQRIRVPLPAGASPAALYRRLRAESPAPFGAFLECHGFQVLSNSPERLLRFDAATRRLETQPIKGTRGRHADPVRDVQAAADLRADPKERAEHVMIVDLQRNDLGRVCAPGSVRVDGLLRVESFAHLHHLVSTVSGRVREGVGLAEILRATFPGGSITGAPKVEAMRVVRRCEPVRRGIYCGALGYFRPDGSFDLALPIRTAVVQSGSLHVYAGGGVVADSTPAGEVEESWLKATAFLRACGVVAHSIRVPAKRSLCPPGRIRSASGRHRADFVVPASPPTPRPSPGGGGVQAL